MPALPSPYIGPRPFGTGEALYGRQREVAELLDLLIAERIVLLHSPSGAGKTSLIQAALIPALQAEEFQVLPVLRVNTPLPPERVALAPDRAGGNRYLYSVLARLDAALLAGGTMGQQMGQSPPHPSVVDSAVVDLVALDLPTYLDRYAGLDESRNTVLIFDQFEELLTLDPTDQPRKEEFFAQVGAVLRNRRRWALFSMRDEYVAQFDTLVRPIPTRFINRYRLEPLRVEAAIDAMTLPARGAFRVEAAQRLFTDLSMVRVRQADGSLITQPGPTVEPVQLQVVCDRLWRQFEPTPDRPLDVEQVANVGSVDDALQDYYTDGVQRAAAVSAVGERTIRDWFDANLITASGLRGQIMQEPGATGGLAGGAIGELVNAHLVRAEERRGFTFYELAHDRLIEPVREANAAWREANLSMLQLQAAVWARADRAASFLLRGQALHTASQWATEHAGELTSTEREFLEQSLAAGAALAKAERQAARIRLLVNVVAIVGVLALVAALVAAWQALRATSAEATTAQERNTALSRQLAAQTLNNLGGPYDLSLLMAVAANQISATLEAQGSLLTALQRYPQVVTYLNGPPDALWSAAFVPGTDLLVTGGENGGLRFWDLAAHRQLTTTIAVPGSLHSLAVSPDGGWLVGGARDGSLTTWPLTGVTTATLSALRGETLALDQGDLNALAFSADGKWLVGASRNGLVVRTGADPRRAGDLPAVIAGALAGRPLNAVTFSPDSAQLAVGHTDDGVVSVWDVRTGAGFTLTTGARFGINSVAFSPDGRRLAAGAHDGSVWVWTSGNSSPQLLYSHGKPVQSVLFSAGGDVLYSAGRDNAVRSWDFTKDAPRDPWTAHRGWVLALAASADGQQMVSVDRRGVAVLWRAGDTPQLVRALTGHADEVWTATFSLDGRWLASGGADPFVLLRPLDGGIPLTLTASGKEVTSLALSGDSRLLAAGTQAGDVWITPVGADSTAPLHLTHTPDTAVKSVAFSPIAPLLASSSLAYHSDEGVFTDTIKLWDLRKNPPTLAVAFHHAEDVLQVVFTHDGQQLYALDAKGAVLRCPVEGGDCVVVAELKDANYSIALAPDEQVLATGGGGDDYAVHLLRLAAQPEDARLRGHGDQANHVAFSPDGRWLASVSSDKTAILWDRATQRSVGTPLRGHDKPVGWVEFSPSGRNLVTAGDDHQVLLWDVDPMSWRALACAIANRDMTADEWATYVGVGPLRPVCP